MPKKKKGNSPEAYESLKNRLEEILKEMTERIVDEIKKEESEVEGESKVEIKSKERQRRNTGDIVDEGYLGGN